ncbi:MAG: ABC transporter ATP-binding protein, partial [Betaproteobacteria bacterium]
MNLSEAGEAFTAGTLGSAAGLHFDSVTKRYRGAAALTEASFAALPGEIVSVTGPSGAGKTTSARLVSGLEQLDGGRILLGGRDLGVLPPQQRAIAHMFESYALYPNLKVFDNVASPLRAPGHGRRIPETEIRERVEALLALTEMESLAARLPAQLSGGQKQRVALCRTLVQTPAAYLLDEPIAHLDAKLRHRLRGDIRRRLKATGKPAVWYTPDAVEAMAVGDRVVVLIGGEVHQQGTPEDVFLAPADIQVARLLGDPPMNLVAATVLAEDGRFVAEHASGRVPLPERLRPALQARSGNASSVVLGLRPAALSVSAVADAAAGLRGEVYTTEPFGKHVVIAVRLGADLVRARVDPLV